MLPADLELLRAKAAANALQYAAHAVARLMQRSIAPAEVGEALATAQVVEDYPDDRFGPSCLLLGTTRAARPLHVGCNYPQRPLLKIITVYELSPTEWEAEFTQRIKR